MGLFKHDPNHIVSSNDELQSELNKKNKVKPGDTISLMLPVDGKKYSELFSVPSLLNFKGCEAGVTFENFNYPIYEYEKELSLNFDNIGFCKNKDIMLRTKNTYENCFFNFSENSFWGVSPYKGKASAVFTNCTFCDVPKPKVMKDSSVSFYLQGAIDVTFDSCTFSDMHDANAIIVQPRFNNYVQSHTKVIFNNCTFKDTECCLRVQLDSEVEFNNCTFTNNIQTIIGSENAKITMNNCTVNDFEGIRQMNNAAFTLTNCKLSNSVTAEKPQNVIIDGKTLDQIQASASLTPPKASEPPVVSASSTESAGDCCPSCGAKLKPNAKFCMNCGAKL